MIACSQFTQKVKYIFLAFFDRVPNNLNITFFLCSCLLEGVQVSNLSMLLECRVSQLLIAKTEWLRVVRGPSLVSLWLDSSILMETGVGQKLANWSNRFILIIYFLSLSIESKNPADTCINQTDHLCYHKTMVILLFGLHFPPSYFCLYIFIPLGPCSSRSFPSSPSRSRLCYRKCTLLFLFCSASATGSAGLYCPDLGSLTPCILICRSQLKPFHQLLSNFPSICFSLTCYLSAFILPDFFTFSCPVVDPLRYSSYSFSGFSI